MTQLPITVRHLLPTDAGALKVVCATRPFPESIFLSAEERRAKVLEVLDDHEHFLWRAEGMRGLAVEVDGELVGYALFRLGQTEGTTGDLQTELLDFYTRSPLEFEPLLSQVIEQARTAGDSYVVAEVFSPQKREAMWLAKAGFRIEQHRNCRDVPPASVSPEHPRFHLRRAHQREMLFIIRLAMTHSPLYTPAGRKVDPHAVSARFMGVYAEMDVRDKHKVPLVLVENRSDLPVGYIILQPKRVEIPGGKLTLYTYDVAVGEEAHGQGLGRYLSFGAMNLMAKMGGGILYGDTPADNKLAQSASEGLGFRSDSHRWGLGL